MVRCPLCGTRRARRGCPALGQQICALCCATKRLTQIRCPSDCAYLAAGREHRSAALVRNEQREVTLLQHALRDLNPRQTQLFFGVSKLVARYGPADQPQLVDDEVAEATAALAATLETASRGVIYEHRPESLPAQHLATALKPLLVEAGKGGGSAFEREAAVALRRFAEAARDVRTLDPGNRRALVEVISRAIVKSLNPPGGSEVARSAASEAHIIVP